VIRSSVIKIMIMLFKYFRNQRSTYIPGFFLYSPIIIFSNMWVWILAALVPPHTCLMWQTAAQKMRIWNLQNQNDVPESLHVDNNVSKALYSRVYVLDRCLKRDSTPVSTASSQETPISLFLNLWLDLYYMNISRYQKRANYLLWYR
jgi:hypothetical protein